MTYVINPSRFSSSSSLLTDLVSWWSLDETSGTRVDSHGSNDLTDTNTVDYTTGKQGNAASFLAANDESLTVADSSLQGGDKDYTISLWVNDLALTNGRAWIVFGSNGTSGVPNDHDYIVGFISSNKARFYTSYGTGWNFVEWGSALSTSTWYHCVVWHDSTAGEIGISINNGTPVINSSLTTPTHQLNATTFQVGKYGSAHLSGYIDEVGYWNRVLTADERTELYNSGNGIAYPG